MALDLVLANILPPNTPASHLVPFTTLATLSLINKEWEKKILEFMFQELKQSPTTLSSVGRVISWFDPSGIVTSTLAIPSGGRNSKPIPIPVCTEWRGLTTIEDSLGVFGFAENFLENLGDMLKAHHIESNTTPPPLGDGTGIVMGATVALPDSATTVPQVSLVIASNLPCVKFLNADSTAATRLQTNVFSTPVPQPVTLFLVGVALEDGCFISGRNSRFELGCMYPTTEIENLMDKSSVKMTASETSVETKIRKIEVDSSDEESTESNRSDESVPPSEEIVEGVTGPGRWHVYTAVYDGTTSQLRVDGVLESTNSDVGNGLLDGLTLGGDHRFDLSLCDGGGGLCGDGDGEGAIAEIAAFKGRLADADIAHVEEYLLKKHGVARGTPQVQLDDQQRLIAHALIHQPQPWKLNSRIPLRIAAAEKTVSWIRNDPISGEKMFVSRIGTNKSDSTSEW